MIPDKRPHDIVEVRGEDWVVAGRTIYDGCALLRLEGRGAANFGRPFSVLEPFDRVTPMAPPRLPRRRRDAVLRHAMAAVANARPAGALWTAAGANIDLLPYQWEPALAVLDGCTRVLLADEVGLGKTVQAGLIVAELLARGLVERALILVPAGLRETWARELRERLRLESRIVDQIEIAQLTSCWPPDVNPWSRRGVTIASIDYVKRAEVLAAIEDVAIDILIADEAHHLTPGSDRGAAVERIASRAGWVVLASATPHSGDDPAFEYLSNLGRAGDQIAIFRRRRHEAGRALARKRWLLAVSPTSIEAELLSGVDAYAQLITRSRGEIDPTVALIASTLNRRAASSATAIARTLTRRLALLAGDEDPLPQQAALPWEEVDEGDADGSATELARPGLDDPTEERRLIARLIELARAAQAGASKVVRLQRLIQRIREPVVVFTEYRDTLEAIEGALRSRHEIAVIHGGLSAPERQRSIDRFNGGHVRLLLATDTGGEGLNLHHRCRLVVTMELPWNPQRLEQRVGRVDRIGQQRRVHAIHLFHAGTIEDLVFARMERRRIEAERALGNLPALTGNPSETKRLNESRRGQAIADRSRHGAGWAPRRGRWRAASRAMAIYESEWLDSSGHVVERRCTGVSIAVDRQADWAALVAALHTPSAVDLSSSSLSISLERFTDSNLDRTGAIRKALARSGSKLQQTSLFDRRAERTAVIRASARRRLDEHLAARAIRLQRWLDQAWQTRTRLIAIWPLGERT